MNTNEIKKKENKKSNLTWWNIINIVCFIIPFIALPIGGELLKALFTMDEYALGIGMIFLIPLYMLVIGIGAIFIGIVSLITTIISMVMIVKDYENNKKIPYIAFMIELLIFVVFILIKFII